MVAPDKIGYHSSRCFPLPRLCPVSLLINFSQTPDGTSENIDPLGAHSDATLNDALGLVHGSARASHSLRNKFRLDTQVAAEGSNFSAGEKQLRRV